MSSGARDTNREIVRRIEERAAVAHVSLSPGLSESLASFLTLLAHWNRTINLTGLDVDPPSDEAIDRLIVEPVAAARYVLATDALAIDVGSGGGSPALPVKLACPALRMVLVESKSRKVAFLNEAVRRLDLRDVQVENSRIESLADRPDLRSAADVVLVRAVRLDGALSATIGGLLKPAGRVLAFTQGTGESFELGWRVEWHDLLASCGSVLAIAAKD